MRRFLRQDQSEAGGSLLIRLLLELTIVFFGVYFAFLFSEYTAQRETKKQQIQLLNGLIQEVDYFLGGAKRRDPGMQEAFAKWQESVAAGEKNTPLYFKMLGDALPTKSMWQVVIFFDGINLLDVPTMFETSKYYNAFDIMLSKYDKLIAFAEVEIIPLEDKSESFYQESGELQPKFAAYVERYDDFLGLFHSMIEKSESLKSLLQSEIDRLK